MTAGVDTHADVHVAAVIDQVGGVLGIETFPTTAAGYADLVAWLRSNGDVDLVGVEGTGSYGAGLCRYLAVAGVARVEVDGPNRQVRRREGKSDPVDAVAAARAALSGQALGRPKSREGDVEAIRVLAVACRSRLRNGSLRDFTWLVDMCVTAELAAAARLPCRQELYEELLPFRVRVVTMDATFICMGAASYHLGMLAASLGRHDDARGHLEHAVALNEAIGAIPWSRRAHGYLDSVFAGTQATQVLQRSPR